MRLLNQLEGFDLEPRMAIRFGRRHGNVFETPIARPSLLEHPNFDVPPATDGPPPETGR